MAAQVEQAFAEIDPLLRQYYNAHALRLQLGNVPPYNEELICNFFIEQINYAFMAEAFYETLMQTITIPPQYTNRITSLGIAIPLARFENRTFQQILQENHPNTQQAICNVIIGLKKASLYRELTYWIDQYLQLWRRPSSVSQAVFHVVLTPNLEEHADILIKLTRYGLTVKPAKLNKDLSKQAHKAGTHYEYFDVE